MDVMVAVVNNLSMEAKPKKLSFFDCLNSINEGSRGADLFKNPEMTEKIYVPFMVNRGLSYFADTILLANEMNRRASVPVQAQYNFLRMSIRPRKRFSKWLKNESSDDLDLIKRAYSFSSTKARQVLPLFSEESFAVLRTCMDTGGK